MIKNGRILQHKNNKTIDFIVNVVRTEKNTMLDFLWEVLPLSQNFGVLHNREESDNSWEFGLFVWSKENSTS
jgi:hypothetical protein